MQNTETSNIETTNQNVELVLNTELIEFVPVIEDINTITTDISHLKIKLPEECSPTEEPKAPREKSQAKQGRPRKYKYIEIDSTTEQPVEVERKVKSNYSSQYYQNHKEIKVICPICLKNVQKYSIGKHQKTKYCQLVASFKETNTNNFVVPNDDPVFIQEITI